MYKFNISKIEIENFRSIRKKISLDIKPGLFAIEGINLDEPASTNGSGKSSLLSAVYWCITGSALTNEVLADEVVNNQSGKNCKVTIYIKTTDSDIIVTRTRKDSELGNNLKLVVNGQDLSCHKMSDTQFRLNQLIKMPIDLLQSTVMMIGDIKSAFSSLTPQQRVQTLESIRDYSLWNNVREEANVDIKHYNKDISECNDKISYLNGCINTYTNIVNNRKDELKVKKDSFDLNKIENDINVINTDIININNKIEILNNEKKLVEDKLYLNIDTESLRLNEITDKAGIIKINITESNNELKLIDRELKIIEDWFNNDKCPTCGKKLDRTKEQILEKENKKDKYLSDKEYLLEKINKDEEELSNKRKEWSILNKKVKEISENKSKILSEKRQIDDKLNLINNELSLKLNKIKELELEKNNHSSDINNIENDIKKYLELINNNNIEKEEFESKVKELLYKKKLSEYYFKLLGSKGELRPYLLKQDISFLNKDMQKYIQRFFKNTTVNLELNGASIDIRIISNGIKKTVSSLSSGEQKRLNLSIQLALYDLLKMASQISFNVLFLDEVEVKLDPIGCQQLIEIIEDKSEDLESVFWITNSAMVKENIPNKIICKKVLGATEVEYL